MSTEDPAPDTESTETTTAPETATADSDALAPTTSTDSEQATTKARRPPEADDPPRGATRSLGGYCPDCNAPMVTRLRANYDQPSDRPMAHLKVIGICDDCDTWLEGELPSVRLSEKEV